MKRKPLSRLAFFLVGILLLGLLPASALAADNEYVLDSIGHTAALKDIDVKETYTATLTVPASFTGKTVNLADGLDIHYNADVYESVVAVFPTGSSAVVDGDPVDMTAVYRKKAIAITYSTNYRVKVTREGISPTFEGTILKNITFPGVIRFTSNEFTDVYKQNDGKPLASIAITGSNPSFGKLKIDGADYVIGKSIKMEDISAGKLSFDASTAGSVSYVVKAYQSGDTENPIGTTILKITSKSPEDTNLKLTAATLKNSPLPLSLVDFTGSFKKETGKALSYVKFDLQSLTNGKLYYNYRSSTDYDGVITSTTAYSITLLPYISFVPKTDFAGTVVIPFTGYTSENIGYKATLSIVVSNKEAITISYKTKKGTPLSFVASDFNNKSIEATGKPLSHVTFSLPTATKGTLYYKFESFAKYGALVASGNYFYMEKDPRLSNVDFVPAVGFASSVSIPYTAYNTDGIPFEGTVKITVNNSDFSKNHAELAKKYPWAADALRYFYDNDILTDEILKKLSPNSSISRSEFILLLSVVFDLEPSWKSSSKDSWGSWSDWIDWDDWDDLDDLDDWEDFWEDWCERHDDDDDDKKPRKNKVKNENKGNKGNKGKNNKNDNSIWSYYLKNYKYNGKGKSSKHDTVKLDNWNHMNTWNYKHSDFLKPLYSFLAGSSRKDNSSLSRQDAMALLVEAMAKAEIKLSIGKTNDLKVFSDYSKISESARQPIADLINAGIISGSDKKLNPNRSLSQIEALVLIYNAVKFTESGK